MVKDGVSHLLRRFEFEVSDCHVSYKTFNFLTFNFLFFLFMFVCLFFFRDRPLRIHETRIPGNASFLDGYAAKRAYPGGAHATRVPG
jgi:hypothetical protein